MLGSSKLASLAQLDHWLISTLKKCNNYCFGIKENIKLGVISCSDVLHIRCDLKTVMCYMLGVISRLMHYMLGVISFSDVLHVRGDLMQ